MKHCTLFAISIVSSYLWFAQAAPQSDAKFSLAPGGQGPTHFLVDVEGEVTLQRSGWERFAPAQSFSTVEPGDLVRLGPAATASIVCADLTSYPLAPGRSNPLPCRSGPRLMTYRGEVIAPTRGADSGDIPIILSPRKTAVRSSNIVLRWSPVPQISEYDLAVRGEGVDWRGHVTNQLFLEYPRNGPALTSGHSYILVVTYKDPISRLDRSSQEEGIAGLGFSILSNADVTKLSIYEKQIAQLGISAIARGFLIANVFATMGLRSEAIDRLEQLATNVPSPATARVLGALYEGESLHRAAERSYLKASNLSAASRDTEGQAIAAERLSEIYNMLGNVGEGKNQLKRAAELYQQLGAKPRTVGTRP
jgi:hypothetical protein